MLPLVAFASGCAHRPIPAGPVRVGSARTFTIPGVAACGEDSQREVTLDPGRPIAVLVHGCKGSERDFGRLADVFALHDRQTVCFRYDDRASVRRTADGLRSALKRLVREADPSEVLVLGHSQGGLVARNALTSRTDEPLESARYHLVTVSSPFGGIRAARDCGSIPLHLGSLGMTLAVCRAVSGAKWNEIHARSSLVRHPALLAPAVREHLTIITDERDTCRRYAADGRTCVQDDFVFSVAEQHNARLLRDERVIQSDVAAGHSEIVGLRGDAPRKLLDALQQHGLLRETAPEDEQAVQRLTAQVGW